MRSSREIVPANEHEEFLRDFDLAQIDSPDLKAWESLQYRERLDTLMREVLRYLPDQRPVADIGCAQGNVGILLAESGARAVCVDLRGEALSYARKKAPPNSVDFVVGSADSVPLGSEALGAVVLGELLEHCAEPQRVLSEARRVLCPGGVLVLSTPNGEYLRNRDPSFAQAAQDVAGLKARQFGPAGQDHLFAFTARELCQLVSQSGLRILRLQWSGTIFYHPRLRAARSIAPMFFWRALGAVSNVLPVWRRYFSETLVAVCQRPA